MTERLRSPQTLFLLLGLLLFLVAFGATAWHRDQAPDLFTDEIIYTRVSTRVAAEGALVWDSGHPTVVHPPLYFLLEGLYLKLTGDPSAHLYTAGDIFAAVSHARLLNALFAGMTALLFYWLGTRLRDWKLGLLLALLFILDPFGLRINRRAMLETSAAFFTLAGMGLILSGLARGRYETPLLSPQRAVVAGALLGAALLTKDLTFTAPLTLALYGAWTWWRERRRAGHAAPATYLPYLLAATVALVTALLVPLWSLIAGHWERYAAVKTLALQRLLGLVQLSGWNRPGVSLGEFLLRRLTDYGSSYLLLGLGGLAVFFLLLLWRRSPVGRLLALWGLVLYPFFGFVALFGSGNDQFFYFLLLPAILFVGYALRFLAPALADRWGAAAHAQRWITAALVALILAYNVPVWFLTYDVGRDNGYFRLVEHAEEMVPPGLPVNATGDALKFKYFFPARPVTDAGTPAAAQAEGIHYFALAPRDVEARYGEMTPALATWITRNGQALFSFEGSSYGPLFLYYVPYPEATPRAPDTSVRVFEAAEGADLSSFYVLLALWGLGISGLLVYMSRPTASLGYRRMEASSHG